MTGPQRSTATEAFTPGQDLAELSFGPISRDDIKAYAEASGDDNPIHQDEEYARQTGAPTVFAMGMLPAGYLATAVGQWFGGPHHLRRFKVRFTTRVWPGDEIVCRGKVVEIDGKVIKTSVEGYRKGAGPDGLELPEEEIAIKAEADVELPE